MNLFYFVLIIKHEFYYERFRCEIYVLTNLAANNFGTVLLYIYSVRNVVTDLFPAPHETIKVMRISN